MANVVETVFQGVDEISGNVEKMAQSMGSLEETAKGLGEVLLEVFAVERLIRFGEVVVETINHMHELNDVLRQNTTSSEQFKDVQEKLVALSIQTEAPLRQTVEFYARLTQATQSLGYTEAQRITIVRSLNDIMKLAGPLAGDVSLQFNRMLLTGELSGRGLVEIFTRAPQLAQLLAEHLGVTIDKLKELGEAGKLNTETVLDALVTRSDTVRKKAEEMGSTTTEAMTNLGTALAYQLDRFEQKFHLIQSIAHDINGIAGGVGPGERSPTDALKELVTVQQKIEYTKQQIAATSNHTGFLSQNSFYVSALAELEVREKELIAEQKRLEVVRERTAIEDQSAKEQRVKHDAEVAAAAEKELAAKGQELSPALAEFITQLQQGYDLTKSMRTEFEKQIEDLHDAQLKFSVGAINEDTLKRIEDSMLQPIVVTAKRKKEVQQDIQAISESWKQAERNMETTLANWFATFDGGLKGLVRSFADTMRKLIAEALAANVMEKIFGFSKGTANQSGTGSATGVIATLLGSLFGGPRASGGWTVPGAVHSINESEPEFLISSDRSRVVPLSKMAANGIGGAGSGVFAPQTTNHISTTMSPFELDAYMRRRDDQLLAKFIQMRRDGVFA